MDDRRNLYRTAHIEDEEGVEKEEGVETGLKVRIVNCEAFTESGETLASESDGQLIGTRPTTTVGWTFFKYLEDDDTKVQSTEKHIREVSSRVKDDAMEYIANEGNDSSIKAALETELGEEWQGEGNGDTTDDDSATRSRTGSGAGSVPEKSE